jgi:hypothetical protein
MQVAAGKWEGVVDPGAPDNLVVAAAPTGRYPGECPHCQKNSTLQVYPLTNKIFGSSEGAVLICDECRGFAEPFRLVTRIIRAVRFISALVLVLGLLIGAPLTFHDGVSFNEWPPLGLLLPLLGIFALGGLVVAWSLKGLAHVIRAGPVVALNQKFQLEM